MKNENYIVIQGFMRNELKLKGNELLIYALIYGFSQDGEDEFTGSVSYLAEWIGATKQTVFNTLKALTEKHLIKKTEMYNNGVKFCRYSVLLPVKKFDEGVVKNFDWGSQKILPNNIVNNIDINNNRADKVVEQYNKICVSLPHCMRLTSKRKHKIETRLNTYSVDDFITAFTKAEESEFLSGRKTSWKASLDWFIENDENMTKVLEGRYDDAVDEIKKAYAELEAERNAERTGDNI